MFDNKLKEFSTNAIEDAIAKAITDLCGEKWACTIKTLDFGESLSGANFVMNICKKHDFKDFKSPLA